MDAQDVQNDLSHVLMSREDVQDTITDLARQIDRDYADKDLLIVAVLKGAVMVVADLTRALHSHVELDFMAVSSYGSGTKSSGVVRILKTNRAPSLGGRMASPGPAGGRVEVLTFTASGRRARQRPGTRGIARRRCSRLRRPWARRPTRPRRVPRSRRRACRSCLEARPGIVRAVAGCHETLLLRHRGPRRRGRAIGGAGMNKSLRAHCRRSRSPPTQESMPAHVPLPSPHVPAVVAGHGRAAVLTGDGELLTLPAAEAAALLRAAGAALAVTRWAKPRRRCTA